MEVVDGVEGEGVASVWGGGKGWGGDRGDCQLQILRQLERRRSPKIKVAFAIAQGSTATRREEQLHNMLCTIVDATMHEIS